MLGSGSRQQVPSPEGGGGFKLLRSNRLVAISSSPVQFSKAMAIKFIFQNSNSMTKSTNLFLQLSFRKIDQNRS